MRQFFWVIAFGAFLAKGWAQDRFIKMIDQPNFDTHLRIQGTSDGGFALFSPDSNTVYTWNACGTPQWARHFELPPHPIYGLETFITTRKHGFAFFIVEDRAGISCTRLVTLDSTGNVVWSRLVSDTQFGQTAYSLAQDKAGSFILYANASRIGGGEVYNMITKIREDGTYAWTRFYNHGGIWGGALVTQDQGILARTGNFLMKTDSNGTLQWTSRISAVSGSMYYTPVEVPNGFIASGKTNNGSLYLCKLTKTGHMTFSNFKWLAHPGEPVLYPAGKNLFAMLLYENTSAGYRPVLVVFNDNLQVVSSRAITWGNGLQYMMGYHLAMDAKGQPLMAGVVNLGDVAFMPRLFFARGDGEYSFDCDSLHPVPLSDGPGNIAVESATSELYPFTCDLVETPTQSKNVEDVLLCGQGKTLSITISADSLLCGKGLLSIANPSPFDSIKWSTGETSTSIRIESPGKYWVKGANLCLGQTASDTIVVRKPDPPVFPNYADTNLCNTRHLVFDLTMEGATYLWHDGSTASTYQATMPGTVSVEVSLQGCSYLKSWKVEGCEIVEMPTLFTPNQDGTNDAFVATRAQGIEPRMLEIFDRWGKRVHSGADFIATGWKGTGHTNGIYFWKIRYTNLAKEEKIQTGTVLLERGP